MILYAAIGGSELLQQCMRYDIFDYMYKPLKQSEFLRCLQRAMDWFKAQKRRQTEDAQTSAEYAAERASHEELFIRAVLDGHVTDDNAVGDGLIYFETALEPDFCVFIVEPDRYESRHESMLPAFKVKRLVKENLDGACYRMINDGIAGITVLMFNVNPKMNIIGECEKIKEQALERLDIRISIGIGSSHRAPSGIAVSYREARAALGYRPAIGYNSVIPIKVAEPLNSVGYAYPSRAEQRFIDSAVMGAYDDCVGALQTITAALDENMPIAKIVIDILRSIDRRAAERGINIGLDENFNDAAALFSQSDAHEYLKSAVRDICELILTVRSSTDASIAERASDYLKAHYYENSSSAKLASLLGTTPEYFDRVFQEYENMGVAEYAARLRIGAAKKLLRQTSLDDEMTAVKVGYDDVKQFRKDFKEYENMSVREFRLGI
jgi:two-component system response regulator YesN